MVLPAPPSLYRTECSAVECGTWRSGEMSFVVGNGDGQSPAEGGDLAFVHRIFVRMHQGHEVVG